MSRLLAISDLHVAFEENRELVRQLRPGQPGDWLIVAGDVGEQVADVLWALELLAGRFAKVVWTPGNHELWTLATDPVRLRGVARYEHLVCKARELGVVTPEDPYPVWTGSGRPVAVAPLFLLYDYSFLPPGATTSAVALELAYERGSVCTDEALLHADPYESISDWCEARLAYSARRLSELDPGLRTVLVNHFPLREEPTWQLRYREFALWCGTSRTAGWPERYNAAAVVYGHLHIPRTAEYGGVEHHEVSVGYPREWSRRRSAPQPQVILG